MNDQKRNQLIVTVLRLLSQGLVILALVTAVAHYDPLRWRAWKDDTIADPDMAIHTTKLGDGTDLLVDPSYYETNVSYAGHYDGDLLERQIAHRVWMLPINEGYTEFWTKHNRAFEHQDPDLTSRHPDSDDYMKIDVIADLAWILFSATLWLGALIVLGFIKGVAIAAEFPKKVTEADVQNAPTRILRILYHTVMAFASEDASEELDEEIQAIGSDSPLLKGAASAVLRGVAFVAREGFSVFVCSVSIVYAFVVLYSFQGKCAADVQLPGRCSIQRTPVPMLHFVVLFILAIIGRIASGYNYSNGSWTNKVTEMTAKFEETQPSNPAHWEKLFSSIISDMSGVTIQSFACAISVGCSTVILILLGSAYFSIGEDRQFPYMPIWRTVLTLELLFIGLNLLVWFLSGTAFVKNLKKMKFYIEGRFFGALFIFAVTLSIYMSLRRGINMHGTLVTSSDMERFGHYRLPVREDVIAASSSKRRLLSVQSIDDTLHDLSALEFESMQLTFEGAFHGKQLSEHDAHCHYIPKDVFKNPQDYSFNQTLCAHGHVNVRDALDDEFVENQEKANDTVVDAQAAYDALVEHLENVQLDYDDAVATLTAGTLNVSNPAQYVTDMWSEVLAAQKNLDDDNRTALNEAKQAYADLLAGSQRETLYGTCCLRDEFESTGMNGAYIAYTGVWVVTGALALQVAIMLVTAFLTKEGPPEDTSNDYVVATAEEVPVPFPDPNANKNTFRRSHIPRGFKTIRVV